jgi:PAS domain S-box-containing protein
MKLNRRYLIFATLIFLLPFMGAVGLFLGEKSERIRFIENERIGLVQHQHLFDLQLVLQRFRGGMFMEASGGSTSYPEAERLREVRNAVGQVDMNITSTGKDSKLALQWYPLRSAIMNALAEPAPNKADARTRFDAHSQMLDDLHLLMREVGNTSNLILEPILPNYYMANLLINILPTGIGYSSHTRTLLAGVLASYADSHSFNHHLMIANGKQQDILAQYLYAMQLLATEYPPTSGKTLERSDDVIKKIKDFQALTLRVMEEKPKQAHINYRDVFDAGSEVIRVFEVEYQRISKTLDGDLALLLTQEHREWSVFLAGAVMAFLVAVVTFIIAHRSILQQDDILRAKQLKESEERFNLVIAGTNDGIWDWVRIGDGTQYWSPQFKRLLGYEENEIIATHTEYLSRIHADDVERVRAHAKQHFTENTPYNIEHRLRVKSGAYVWFRAKATTVRDHEGNPVRMVGSIRDISARKEAEERLRESEERLQLAITGSTDGLWDWNVETGEVYYSPRFMALTGHAPDELPHCIETFSNYLLHEEDRATMQAETQRHFTDRKPYAVEYRLKHKDGYYLWCQARGQASWNAQGRAVRMTGFTMDISERKAAEEKLLEYAAQMEQKSLELEEAKEQAEEATRLKSDFLANMSHEIRTPMNGIIGMSSLLMDTDLNAEQRGFATTVIRSSEALLQIVNDILDFSKIEAGKLEMETIPFDFQVLCEEVADLMAVRAHETNIELLLCYGTDLPRHVLGDAGRVRQILFNLISNAIKFTPKGHVLVTVDKDSDTDTTTQYRITIEDTGIGIPADKLDYIFNKFTQADGSTTRKFGGTGLGLAICKQLVQMMGGEIGVRSVEGKGSTFWFTLTLEKDSSATYAAVPVSLSVLRGKQVLLVDDNPTARMVARAQLAPFNVQICETTSASEAFATLLHCMADNTPIDAVVMDYLLPDSDGLALAERIRAHPSLQHMPLLMLTSVPMRGDCHRLLQEKGIGGYLPKPLKAEELPEMLALMLTKHATQQAVFTRYNLQENRQLPARQAAPECSFEGVHVLVAEDNQVNQMVAKSMLTKLGVQVTIANHGGEVLALLKQQRFDLILMDCQMPVMDGFEATHAIRLAEAESGLPHMPIVALTANAMKGDEEVCLAAGMDGYLTKPLKPEQLRAVLMQWMIIKTD